MIDNAFKIIDAQLSGRPFGAGDQFSIADPALFYVERWAPQKQITLPRNVSAHYQRMLERPSVQKVRKIWAEN